VTEAQVKRAARQAAAMAVPRVAEFPERREPVAAPPERAAQAQEPAE